MTADSLQTALDRAYPPGSSARSFRVDALAAFHDQGFPTRHIEAWHYTDLGRVTTAGLDYSRPETSPAALSAAADAIAKLPIDPAAPLAVFVDGVLTAGLSRLDGLPGITLAARQPAELPPTAASHALAALAAAFAEPVTVTCGRDIPAETPLTLVFVAATPGLATQMRLGIDVAADTRATLVQHFVSVTGESEGWTNVSADIALAPDAALELYRVQSLGPGQSLTTLLAPTLSSGAKLDLGTIDTGGGLVRTAIEFALDGAGADAGIFGLAMPGEGQHIDNYVCADHRSPDTKSLQTFRSVVDAGGRAVFNGKVIVRPDAQRIDAHQSSDNLLLAPSAEVDTRPELEIYADDVKCSHGATVGEIDAGEMFYLCSRGLSADEARKLLTFGFANRILERIPVPGLKRWLGQRIAGTLIDTGAADEVLEGPAEGSPT